MGPSPLSPHLTPREGIITEMVTVGEMSFEVDMCGGGDTLALCLHGFPEHNFAWRYQLPALAQMGYRVWAPNLRGYGRTTRPDGVAAYGLDHLLDDIARLIDASGAKRTVLIAHDWGGIIAWTFAALQLRPLHKFVAMNIPHPNALLKTRTLEQALKSYYILLFQIPRLPELALTANRAGLIRRIFQLSSTKPEMFPKEVTDIFRENVLDPGAITAMLNYYRAFFRHPLSAHGRMKDLPKIITPSLLIWGEKDLALTKKSALNSADYVEDLQYAFLPDGSHWIQQERPDEVNAAMKAFLGPAPK
ncbi:Alpha/beta hydrolase fold protein [Parvularcula bermudensis HTCC2503]|uniref:Alpha/beta hydrolase fold protein n=1 Tax=Parvularcula bermudensis (strain ATCC BAA-594 / HTCC2503 / KCTC 12087) TaxID=314260 RepID=E0TDU2_PARBH|nr:alpha/beta hydrolase [Parvularcula bermudensis]ADM10008.1 Alpha/beta hydrolase fold protein [Parvularcula bermudensis HTCC2503]